MSEKPLISIIIPAYNHEKYVEEAIYSVLEQTYDNIELIIVNDGSHDSTWTKINEMKTKCDARCVRVIFETQENQGTCYTLNRLLELSQGEYIHLLASDDRLTSNSTEILYDFLSENPDYALAVGENLIIDDNGKHCYWDKHMNNVYDLAKAKWTSFSHYIIQGRKNIDFLSSNFGSYRTLLEGNYIPNGYLIRKNIFDKTGYFTKDAPLEDYYLMLQIAKYSKMKYIPVPTFYYRWHGNNTILQSEKMSLYANKTFEYEKEQVENASNQEIQKILNDFLLYRKSKVSWLKNTLMKLFGIDNA